MWLAPAMGAPEKLPGIVASRCRNRAMGRELLLERRLRCPEVLPPLPLGTNPVSRYGFGGAGGEEEVGPGLHTEAGDSTRTVLLVLHPRVLLHKAHETVKTQPPRGEKHS